jgi:hypothetical protein
MDDVIARPRGQVMTRQPRRLTRERTCAGLGWQEEMSGPKARYAARCGQRRTVPVLPAAPTGTRPATLLDALADGKTVLDVR